MVDFQDSNTITVEITEEGPWQYQLDGGLLQSANVFTNVLAGPRRVAVYAEDCLIYEEDIFVGGAPNYFTPNGDGFHDSWHIFNALEFPGANIKIYDRYGKILRNLRHDQAGWDGTYRGNPMPSSDYWYMIELPDGRNARGHFSLIRR